MKVGAITGIKEAKVIEIAKPKIKSDEVLVRVKACAICTFEQRIFDGTKNYGYPYLGGHEVAGVIEELGSDVNENAWYAGQNVAVRTLDFCCECDFCKLGETTMCTEVGKSGRRVPEMDGIGGLAEFLVAKPKALFALSDKQSLIEASLVEPLACVIHSIDRANIQFGDTVVIIGAGIMGLLHLQLAKLKGADVVVLEVDETRRQKALSLGASHVSNPIEIDSVEYVKKITGGKGAEVVICTPAISKVAEDAVKMLSQIGKLVLYGSFHPDTPLAISPNLIHYSQLTVTGVVNPGAADFVRATRMLNKGVVSLNDYIDAQYPIDEIQKAYEASISPNTYRVVVTF
ncbi:zinc-binding dehydrogenase [Clostridia bacterium]|nr:zinc-binding dehydrogenase [Clostridia bacterium]